MKRPVWLVTLLCLFLTVFALGPALADPPPAAPSATSDAGDVERAAPEPVQQGQEPELLPSSILSTPSETPSNVEDLACSVSKTPNKPPEKHNTSCCIDRCFKDSHCDAFCGGKGFGVCVQVNSCCNQCFCAG